MFKKCDIHGVVYFLGDGWVTFISLFIGRIPKKRTFDGFGIQFAAVLLMDMDKCRAPEYFRIQRGDYFGVWKHLNEGLARGLEFKDSRRHSINEICRCKDCLSPEVFWNMRSEHQGPSNLEEMPILSLGNPVLFMSVNTRTLMDYALAIQIITQNSFEIFFCIISSEKLGFLFWIVFGSWCWNFWRSTLLLIFLSWEISRWFLCDHK